MLQAEDEIASIGMVLGAAFAGVRSMTATSGPGLSLMTELLGLSGMAEIPCVVVDVQRGGPSTGLPTKTEQGDLSLALAMSHGDVPKVILAPISIHDCFDIMFQAFDIAERFQVPVHRPHRAGAGPPAHRPAEVDAARSSRSSPSSGVPQEFDPASYLRFALTESGVSPRVHPGRQGRGARRSPASSTARTARRGTTRRTAR